MAADIDLLIKVDNLQANRALRETATETENLAAPGGVAANAFERVSGSFDRVALRASLMVGGLGHVRQLLAAVTLLTDPVTATALAVGGLVYGIVQLVEESQKFIDERVAAQIAKEFKSFEDSTGAYLKALKEGKTEQQAFGEQLAANAKSSAEFQIGTLKEVLAEDEAALKRSKFNLEQTHNAMVQLFLRGEVKDYENQIASLRDQIEKLAKGEGDWANFEKGLGEKMKPNNDALKERERLLGDIKMYLLEIGEAAAKGEGRDPGDVGVAPGLRGMAGMAPPSKAWSSIGVDEIAGLHDAGLSARDAFAALAETIVTALFPALNEGSNAALLMTMALTDVMHEADTAVGEMAVGAFDAYYNAIDKTISLNNIFANHFDRTMRNVAASVLKSIGMQSAAKGGMALADSLVQLAIGNTAGAALDAEAAGIYFALAAAFGAAGAATSVSAGGSSGYGGAAGAGGGYYGAGSNQAPVYQTVVVFGTLDDRGAEELSNQLEAARKNRSLN